VLHRTELVALFNTLARISSSLEAIHNFRTMVEAEETEAESVGHHHVMSDRVTKPHHVVPGKEFAGSIDDDFDEHVYEPKARKHEETVGEIFYKELDLIWRVTKYVIRGWIRFPKTM